MSEPTLTKQAGTPAIDELWIAVERSLDDASKAFPVLLTMLKKAKDSSGRPVDLRGGAMVADEMIANVKYAIKALPTLRAMQGKEQSSAAAPAQNAGPSQEGAAGSAVDHFVYATTEDLAKEFGASPAEAKAIHARVERLAGGTLSAVADPPPPEDDWQAAVDRAAEARAQAARFEAKVEDRSLIVQLSTALHAVTAMLDDRYHATVSFAMAQEAMAAERKWRVADEPAALARPEPEGKTNG